MGVAIGSTQMLLAGSIITAIPLVILYLVFQRYVAAGFREMGEGSR